MDFSVERALVGATGVLATFDYGLNGIQTACHFAAETTDEIYAVKGPKAFRHYEGKLSDMTLSLSEEKNGLTVRAYKGEKLIDDY